MIKSKEIIKKIHEKMFELFVSGCNEHLYKELQTLISKHVGEYEADEANNEAETHKNFCDYYKKVKKINKLKNK